MTQSDVVFCPLWTFKGQQLINGELENVCYRDAITQLTLVVMKDTASAQHVVTPAFSSFRNLLASMQLNTKFYSFAWTMSVVSTPRGSTSAAQF